MNTETNPLYAKQREYSGSSTFHKYLYQYNWAIFTIFDLYKDNIEYVVFPELHEDIVIGNSLEFEKVLFDFNQVKCIETGQKYTLADLVYKDPKSNSNSILGKLLENNNSHNYSSKIKNLNLVASCGFKFEIKDETKLLTVNIHDIEDKKGLKDKLLTEMALEKLPDNLNFIDPNFPPSSQRYTVIGRISDVLNEKYPKLSFNPTTIYQSVFDEICKKGEKVCDYKDWNEAVKNKSISSEKINILINEVVVYPNIETNQINDFLEELKLNARTKQKYHNRYREILINNTTANQTALYLEKNLKPLFNEGFEKTEDTLELITFLKDNASQDVIDQFIDDIDFHCRVIFFIIERINYER
ncbi:UNVERIFIED_CONTAM: DUF4297 domain-containing protein [Acinetobacter baumannii]|uniref:dsDNA nuclease domain-containing protein n=3 Tax=Acinetobacter baumannii TaxID=470 RepID=UPI0011A690D9|nr:dsDNA nuclease domain-containing protein [Acinetobacter baumannii]MBR8591248.1 DUF4297 domain-containing protein [Acinetobacter baumannii]MCG9252249.1 DUF4297 domain-containing protein [Acinetobacter baumannii]MCO9047537.1 DUF4297 domain-containing protein [Acinetobacter baumannii]MCO9054737.1 DUF4297 domain-containing protein [Acinetobacter baumannii]MCO9058650.1 DUF4297 domain-containing protein [Acinetobacter baumannii]